MILSKEACRDLQSSPPDEDSCFKTQDPSIWSESQQRRAKEQRSQEDLQAFPRTETLSEGTPGQPASSASWLRSLTDIFTSQRSRSLRLSRTEKRPPIQTDTKPLKGSPDLYKIAQLIWGRLIKDLLQIKPRNWARPSKGLSKPSPPPVPALAKDLLTYWYQHLCCHLSLTYNYDPRILIYFIKKKNQSDILFFSYLIGSQEVWSNIMIKKIVIDLEVFQFWIKNDKKRIVNMCVKWSSSVFSS